MPYTDFIWSSISIGGIPPLAVNPAGTKLIPPPPGPKEFRKYAKRCPSILSFKPLGFDGVPLVSVDLTPILVTQQYQYRQAPEH